MLGHYHKLAPGTSRASDLTGKAKSQSVDKLEDDNFQSCYKTTWIEFSVLYSRTLQESDFVMAKRKRFAYDQS